MKEIKKFPKQNVLNGESGSVYSIYELNETEMRFSEGKKYFLSQTLSQYAMNNMSKVDIIQRSMRESQYIYGTAFCDTIREAELYYKCCVLEIQLREVKDLINSFSEKAVKQSTAEVSVFDKGIKL